MRFKDGFWTAMGDAATMVLNPAYKAIIDTLHTTGSPMTPSQLATTLGANLNTMKVHLLRLVERGLVVKVGQGQYTHRILSILTPEGAKGETACNPVTETPPGEEERPAAVPDITEHEDPIPQDIPLMDTPASVDETPTAPAEETPEAQTDTRVSMVTPDAPPPPRDELIFRHTLTNGHSNGYANGVSDAVGGTGASSCLHEAKTTETYEDGSVLVKCGVCRRILDVQP
jgi:hypothetical protein